MAAPSDRTDVVRLRACVADDFRRSSWAQRVLLVATVGWIAYEWGLGNETVTPWILVRVVADTSGATSVVATAAVGFTFTAAQQAVSGVTAMYGFAMFHRTADAAWRRLRRRFDGEPTRWHRLGLLTKVVVVFTLGTTAVVLIESSASGEGARARLRPVVLQAAALCGAVVAVIGAIGAGAVLIGRSVPVLEPATDRVVNVLGNPLLWIGLLLVVVAAGAARRRTRGR